MVLRVLYHHRSPPGKAPAPPVREMVRAFRDLGCRVAETAMVGGRDETLPPLAAPAESPLVRLLPRFGREILEHACARLGEGRVVAEAVRFAPHFIYERHALANLAGARARSRLDIPLFLEVTSPPVHRLEGAGKLVFRRWARRVEGEVLRRADLLFTLSGVLKRMLVGEGVGGERILVLPHGVDPEPFAALPDRDRAKEELGLGGRFLVGLAGPLSPRHRGEQVLQAMAELERRGREGVHMVVVGGEGAGIAFLRRRAQKLGLEGRLTVTAPRPARRLAPLLAALDAAVVPAAAPHASPLELFLYLAASRPLVVPDQENLRELVQGGETALTFAPGDPDSLAGALAALIDDPGLGERIGAAGRRKVTGAGWNWRARARRVVQAYEERFAS